VQSTGKNDKQYYPGLQVYLAGTTTTLLGSPTTTAGPTTTTTTTPYPNCGSYQPLNESWSVQDCWIAVRADDVDEGIRAGDVFGATFIGVHTDGIAVFLVSAGCASDSTSTTTSTTGACGTCKWTWDNTAKAWTQTTSSCSGSCVCIPPTMCGSTQCEVRHTDCAIVVGTTTTKDCSTTTTSTTPGPPPTTTTTFQPCLGTCQYKCINGTWLVQIGGCSSSHLPTCYCLYPTYACTAERDCETVLTACGYTTAVPCLPQHCYWYCTPGVGWTGGTGCGINCDCCASPTEACCYSWQTIQSVCTNGTQCSTTSPPCNVTTTTALVTTTAAPPP